jgi:hypothetical protein
LMQSLRGSCEYARPLQSVGQPGDGLSAFEVAGPAAVVASAPAPRLGVLAGAFLEREPVHGGLLEHFIVGHRPHGVATV